MYTINKTRQVSRAMDDIESMDNIEPINDIGLTLCTGRLTCRIDLIYTGR